MIARLSSVGTSGGMQRLSSGENVATDDVLPEDDVIGATPQLIEISRTASLNPIRPEVGLVKTVSVLWSASKELVWWLGMPGLWAANFIWLLLYVIVMLPAFIPVFFYYVLAKRVVKNVCYGPSIRHQLDIYLPERIPQEEANCTPDQILAKAKARKGSYGENVYTYNKEREDGRKRPIVIFVSGGAWIIGYKLWPFMMGRVFQANGVIFVSPDYRNFPQGTAVNMVADVTKAVKWVLQHAEDIGGDPSNITLMGQSAGAHLTALALINAAEKEASGGQPPWRQGDIARFVGISGPYDIVGLIPAMHKRGLHRRVLQALMEDPVKMSPIVRVHAMPRAAADLMPPVSLYHGTADATVPYNQTEAMAEALKSAHVQLDKVVLMVGKSHTDPILEDPAGGEDPLMVDLIEMVHAGTSNPAILPRRLPKAMQALARWLNPF